MQPGLTVREYVAAGAVVTDETGMLVLLLRRPGRSRPDGNVEIRLPKGHIEAGESHREAASREVEEETGLSDLIFLADLGQQRVQFDWRGAHFIRAEHYFLMRGTPTTRESPPESQFERLWVTWDEALDSVTFEAEREWLRRAKKSLQ